MDVDAIARSGLYAVHRAPNAPKAIAVTHIPTGLAVIRKDTIEEAREFARAMHKRAGNAGKDAPFGYVGADLVAELRAGYDVALEASDPVRLQEKRWLVRARKKAMTTGLAKMTDAELESEIQAINRREQEFWQKGDDGVCEALKEDAQILEAEQVRRDRELEFKMLADLDP